MLLSITVGTTVGGGSACYYGENREHARYPWESRNISEERQHMIMVEEEDRPSVRANLAKNCGYTGYSILWRLHECYGFDVCKDLVFDMMHNISLNLLKNHLRRFIAADILDVRKVEERLQEFPWTAGL